MRGKIGQNQGSFCLLTFRQNSLILKVPRRITRPSFSTQHFKGTHHDVPQSMTCDDCEAAGENNLATHRIQGETDSMGSEMIDLCNKHYAEYRQSLKDFAVEVSTGNCEWCKNHATTLKDQRDYDEGTSGRVYKVCKPCRDKYRKKLEAEMDDCDPFGDMRDDDYDEGNY